MSSDTEYLCDLAAWITAPDFDADEGMSERLRHIAARHTELQQQRDRLAHVLTAAPDIPEDWPSEDAVEAMRAAYGFWKAQRDAALAEIEKGDGE